MERLGGGGGGIGGVRLGNPKQLFLSAAVISQGVKKWNLLVFGWYDTKFANEQLVLLVRAKLADIY